MQLREQCCHSLSFKCLHSIQRRCQPQLLQGNKMSMLKRHLYVHTCVHCATIHQQHPVFMLTLFTQERNWKRWNCPSTDDGSTENMEPIDWGTLLSHRKDGIQSFRTRGQDTVCNKPETRRQLLDGFTYVKYKGKPPPSQS